MKPTTIPQKQHIFNYFMCTDLDLEIPFHLNGEEGEEVCRELREG